MSDRPESYDHRLDYLRDLAAQIDERDVTIDSCPHDAGERTWARILTSGSIVHFPGCVKCSAPTRSGKFVKVIDHAVPVALDERALRPPCVRCGEIGTEIHHWAPRAWFGPTEAECWPTDPLCKRCHDEWHRTILESVRHTANRVKGTKSA